MKVYYSGSDILVSACDEDLLGKRFKQGKFQINVSKDFYGGELVDEEELKDKLRIATIANLVGEVCVNCAIKLGLVDESNVLRVKGVPHAQMVRVF